MPIQKVRLNSLDTFAELFGYRVYVEEVVFLGLVGIEEVDDKADVTIDVFEGGLDGFGVRKASCRIVLQQRYLSHQDRLGD